jgi:hypothetical protein
MWFVHVHAICLSSLPASASSLFFPPFKSINAVLQQLPLNSPQVKYVPQALFPFVQARAQIIVSQRVHRCQQIRLHRLALGQPLGDGSSRLPGLQQETLHPLVVEVDVVPELLLELLQASEPSPEVIAHFVGASLELRFPHWLLSSLHLLHKIVAKSNRIEWVQQRVFHSFWPLFIGKSSNIGQKSVQKIAHSQQRANGLKRDVANEMREIIVPTMCILALYSVLPSFTNAAW